MQEETSRTVSYTHLDVYKRQETRREEKEAMSTEDVEEAVSYTHLDVYKRQQ